jgi:hypothetical protein
MYGFGVPHTERTYLSPVAWASSVFIQSHNRTSIIRGVVSRSREAMSFLLWPLALLSKIKVSYIIYSSKCKEMELPESLSYTKQF